MSTSGLGRGRGLSIQRVLHSKSNSRPPGTEKIETKTVKTLLPVSRTNSENGDGTQQDDLDNIYDSVIRKVTASYVATDGDDYVIESKLGQTKEIFDTMMSDDSNVCLICLDNIERKDAVWSCSFCYCIMHLRCIQMWINEGSYQQQMPTLSEEHFPNKRLPWHCPKCRTEYSPNNIPSSYYCFCGKVKDPEDDPWIVPHSCGETCDKKLLPLCGHKCLLLCHPGPCPPCPKSVMSSCFCGKNPKTPRRCAAREWSCGKTCDKLLACKQHRCSHLCHKGECKPCPEVSIQSCMCGKSKQQRPCAEPSWSCGQVCGRKLSCGHHFCEKICHPKGDCGECERSARIRYCPCGKTSATDVPCTQDVPCCGDTCGKSLACGLHNCTEKCHKGPCAKISIKSCRCGAKKKELTCSKSFTCDIRCQNMKSCGRHQCKKRCCDGTSCSDCDQPCGKKLNCGNHKCQSMCHVSKCYPCPVTVNKHCNCGKTILSVPCIRSKTAKPPRCRLPCRKTSLCDHKTIQKHPCHFGECPPCTLICGKKLRNCNHTCSNRCHDAVKIKVLLKEKAAGPWEQKPRYTLETVSEPCPPCPVPTPVSCKGQHEVTNLPCSASDTYSCQRRCGRKLTCGNHTCNYVCHSVTDNADSQLAGPECEICEKACEKPRLPRCSHECPRPCHPGKCPLCKQMIKTRCHCGVTVMYIPCYEWTDGSFDRDTRLACPGDCPKLLSCGHQCAKTCHPAGDCTTKCEKRVTVRCECRRKKETFTCHLASDVSLSCDEICESRKQKSLVEDKSTAESDEGTVSESGAASMLPGRRQRRRKDKRSDSTETVQSLPWNKIRKYSVAMLGVLVLVAAFVFALLSEN